MRIIAGTFKGRKLHRPCEKNTRPTTDRTRESIFNILTVLLARQDRSFDELDVLDVFAGSGALGFEALSRGARSATFIERDKVACGVIDQNAKTLKIESKAKVLLGDALSPPRATHSYDLLFLDPPYGKNALTTSIQALSQKGWVARDAIVVMESSSKEATPFIEGFSLEEERLYGATKICFFFASS